MRKSTHAPLAQISKQGYSYFVGAATPSRIMTASSTIFVFIILLLLPLLTSQNANALALTWDGGGADNNWSTCANWTSDTCPGSGDALTFNSTSTKDSVVDAGFGGAITSINITTGYSGTLSLSRSLQTSSTFTQSTGTFTANAQTLDVDGAFSTTGGTFNASSGTMTFGSGFTIGASATFNHNSGTVTIDTSNGSTITCNNAVFNLVTFAHPSSTKTISSGCNLPLGVNPTIGSGTAGITLNGTFSGTGTLAMTGGLTISSTGSLSGFTGFTNTGAVTMTGATANFGSYTTFTIGGTVTVQTSANVTLPSNADFNGSFLLLTSSTLNMPSGSVYFGSTFTLSSGTTFNANSGTVVFDTSSAVTLSCGSATFNLVQFAHPSSTKIVSSDCNLPLGANPTIGSGTAVVTLNGTLSGTGTITFPGALTINSTGVLSGFTGLSVSSTLTITGATANFSSYSTFAVTSTFTAQTSANVTLPSNADFNGAFIVSTSSTMNMPSGSVYFASTFTLNSGITFNANSGTVVFDGGTATITCNSATFNAVTFAHTANTKTVSTGCTLPLGSNPTIGVGAVSLALTGTLTGSGTLTIGNSSGGTLQLNSGYGLSGFTNYSIGTFVVNGATADFSALSAMTVIGSFTLQSSGVFTAPTTFNVGNFLTINAGTTFNHNNGTVVLYGTNSSTITCNGATFNLVSITATGSKVISSNCNLPLGNNPVVAASITLNGTLSGTGTLTINGSSFFYNSTALISGFSGLATVNTTLTSSTLDLTSYNPVTIGGNLTVTSTSSFTGPTAGMSVTSGFNIASGSTFNANGGTLTLGGISRPGTVCDGTVTFTKVVLANTVGTRVIEASCTLPLGDNPTISAGGDLLLKGTFVGTGKISAPSGTTLALLPGSNVTGFTTAELGNVIVYTSFNASSYTNFKVLNDLTLIKPAVFTAPVGTLEVKGNIYNAPDDGFLRLNGAVGERAYTTDSAATSITGDIDIRVKAELDMWTYGQNLIGKYNATGNNRCYQFTVGSSTGYLGFAGSLTGAATNYSAISTAAPSVSNFGTLWVRVTRNATTGDVNFYTSSDGSSWSQLGGTVSTTAGALYDCAADLDIGANSNGAGSNAIGRFYKVQIRNNILDNGSGIVFDADFTNHASGTTSFTESSSNGANVQLGTGINAIYGTGAATFSHNNGTVNLSGTNQEIQGDWNFYNLTKEVTSEATLTMPAGRTITVDGHLRLKGKGTQYLYLVSSSPGTQWLINRKGTSYMSKLAVRDSRHINNTLVACYSTDNGNNYRWAFNTDACYSSTSSTAATAAADTEVAPTSAETDTEYNSIGYESSEQASAKPKNKYIIGGSLLVALGGIWWLVAVARRKNNEPVQWQ